MKLVHIPAGDVYNREKLRDESDRNFFRECCFDYITTKDLYSARVSGKSREGKYPAFWSQRWGETALKSKTMEFATAKRNFDCQNELFRKIPEERNKFEMRIYVSIIAKWSAARRQNEKILYRLESIRMAESKGERLLPIQSSSHSTDFPDHKYSKALLGTSLHPLSSSAVILKSRLATETPSRLVFFPILVPFLLSSIFGVSPFFYLRLGEVLPGTFESSTKIVWRRKQAWIIHRQK